MSWLRRKRIYLPPEDKADGERSEAAVRESEEKLAQARKQKEEAIRLARKSREISRKSDFFAEALERAMRRNND